MGVAVIAGLFDGANQTGTTEYLAASTTGRYRRMRRSELSSDGLLKKVSSVTCYSGSGHTTLLLLGFPNPLGITLPDFTGRFVQVTNAASGAELDVNLSTANFDNRAESALLVRTAVGTEVRFSFRDLFLTQWNTMLDAQLGGNVSRDGNPILTWDMFPTSTSYLDPNLMYLKIHQDLDISIPWWPDYDASITYHIFLYLDGSGRLRGYVARWRYWIEGGVKTDDIEDRLRPAVITGADTLNDELGGQLARLSSATFRGLYYLPGRQLAAAATGVASGYTWDDTTIVLQV